MTRDNETMKQDEKFSIDRRDVLIGAGALGASAIAATALGGAAIAGSMEGHQHAAGGKNQALAKALHECIASSEACINHCLDTFKAGDVSLADCAISVQETMAFCTAHARLASYDSKHLKEMCELGIKVCADCEKECRKHEKKHALCKDCADACASCIKECKKFIS